MRKRIIAVLLMLLAWSSALWAIAACGESTDSSEVENSMPDGGLVFELTEGGYEVSGYGGASVAVTIPGEYKDKPVVAIGVKAFSGCDKVTSISLPSTIRTIGVGAFTNCAGLTSITIGRGVEIVDYGAFNFCSNLKFIYCEAESKPEGWSEEWSRGCSAEIVWGYKG